MPTTETSWGYAWQTTCSGNLCQYRSLHRMIIQLQFSLNSLPRLRHSNKSCHHKISLNNVLQQHTEVGRVADYLLVDRQQRSAVGNVGRRVRRVNTGPGRRGSGVQGRGEQPPATLTQRLQLFVFAMSLVKQMFAYIKVKTKQAAGISLPCTSPAFRPWRSYNCCLLDQKFMKK